MNHDVFDTCIILTNGERLCFDVLMPAGLGKEEANNCALLDCLENISIKTGEIESSKHHFCHNPITKPEIEWTIKQQGYAITKSKGCPGYYR